MSKKAIVTGIRGQDGAYLAKFLLERGYKVYGADRRSADQVNWRLKELNIHDQIEYVYLDLTEITNILNVLKRYQVDEIYNLAAQSFVSTSFMQPVLTCEVDGMGVLRFLEAAKTMCPEVKFYQASTSEMFGKVQHCPQNEQTAFYPRSPYGIAKLMGHWSTVSYRESYGMYCCSGILFNHESPLRGIEFVTRKITSTVAKINHGLADKLVLGNLAAKRDWGYAQDYVEGMWLMLQQGKPDDYVLATGVTHTVQSFVEESFRVAGTKIEWRGEGQEQKGFDAENGKCLVEVSKDYFRPAEVDVLSGDAGKAERVLGWKPKVGFLDLVQMMTEADLRRAKADQI